MGKKILTVFLCFCLSWTSVMPAYGTPLQLPASESAIRAQYPDAQIIHVSPEEYPALESTLLREGYRQATDRMLLSANEARNYRFEVNDTEEAASLDECRERNGDRSSGEESFRLVAEMTDDMMTTKSNNSKGAAVLFVIVGTVVLIVWTLYLFKYLYDVSLGLGPCGRWSEMVAASSSSSGDSDQHARFAGLRYLTGYRDGYTDFGISIEVGHADIRLTEVSSLDLQGVYWLIGPLLRWRFRDEANPNYFQMEFAAGSTEHEEMGLIASAKAGLSFGVGKGFRWGISYGAMSMDLNDNQGIITDRSQYRYLLGLDLGYRF